MRSFRFRPSLYSDPREKSLFFSGFGLRPRNLHRTQPLHAKNPLVHMLKSYLGLSVLSRGHNRTQYLSGCCVLLRMFFFGWGRGWRGGGVCLPGQKRLLSLNITMRFTTSIKVQSQSLRITLDCSL